MNQQTVCPRKIMEPFVLVLAPYAPHICEEIWNRLGHSGSLTREPYPVADIRYCHDDVVSIGVQIDGKIREHIDVTAELSEEEVLKLAQKNSGIQHQLQGKVFVRTKYLPGTACSVSRRDNHLR